MDHYENHETENVASPVIATRGPRLVVAAINF